MKILFYKNNLQNNIPRLDEITNLWKQNFNDDMSLLPETHIGVLSIDDIIVGIVFLLFPTDLLLKKNDNISNNLIAQNVTIDDCYLYNFCISANEQKKGYGSRLLEQTEEYVKEYVKEYVEEYVKKQNINKVILFVKGDNVPAIKLYNNFKYKVQKATPNGFIMEKILSIV